MNRIKVSNNFYLDEYIPKNIYLSADRPEELISFIDPMLICSDQLLRDIFGPATINNWWDGGERIYSGFRPVNCSIGAQFSDHKKGMASDKIFKNATPDEVREYIKAHWKDLGITKIEEDVSWVHTSVAKTDLTYLKIFFK